MIKYFHKLPAAAVLGLLFLSVSEYAGAQFVDVGSGSYTTVFPGTDEAGRNKYPSGTPLLSGSAAGKPVPTNDWWSAKVKNNHVSNLFTYPFTLKTVNAGLVVSYIPWGVIDDLLPVTVGVSGLNADKATVSDYSDWTVSVNWNDGTHDFSVTAGIGMPFLYFTRGSADAAVITVTSGTVTIDNELLLITNAKNGADFAVYAPAGSSWTQNGNSYTSELNGKNYWSLAFLPPDAGDIPAVANEYRKYAYVFPVSTTADWSYDENTSVVRTVFTVATELKEGSDTKFLLGLLPHQWAHLSADSPQPGLYSYPTVRGVLKTMAGNSFSVENTFHGILPTLPYLDNYSAGFDPALLDEKIGLIENDGLASWTDSYNEGQVMNRLIQTARIADLTGNTTARDKIIATISERLEDWLKAEAGEVAFLFYYNSTWSAMLGYPAGHMQDENLNDHHFHWGYFIHAAAFLEQYQPGWAAEWGPMIDLLIRDAASADRSDSMFPFMRNFSPYAGHCWANGFASFPQGNDQESTSESMQFNSSLIHWGAVTGNDAVRDLGIYLYTTEQTAIEEYWFDIHERNFKEGQSYSLVSRIWGNSYDNGTFWTSDIAASYGIEIYPVHGGSLYLGQHPSYAAKLWNEIKANTGIMSNEVNPNLWHDVMWEYCAFTDPQTAIDLYDSNPDRSLKFGISDAQTYYWLHAMNALGQVDTLITADHPLAAVFNKGGELTYVAQNYSAQQITVTFSDQFTLDVPARSMATSRDIALSGTLSSSFGRAYTNGSVGLELIVDGGSATKVAFYDGSTLIGEDAAEPFALTATKLRAGKHHFYARIYAGDDFTISNIVQVIAGNQLPFTGTAAAIPGTFEAGNYDSFEGGNGQGIAYSDASVVNEGDYRSSEYVDAGYMAAEGATVGWISGGEWLEYTVNVEQPGYYTLAFRYACGNTNGGGPFSILLDDQTVKTDIAVGYTGDWDTWATKTVDAIPLSSGEHVLRLAFDAGELNLGRFTFSYASALDYDQPVANAGPNRVVVWPESSTTLDGSGSTDPQSAPLSYSWTQVYGPSVLIFSDPEIVNPQISSLTLGIYLLRLTVTNGSYTDDDELYVIVSPTANIAPVVTLTAPADHFTTTEGKTISLAASASDLDGTIAEVSFYSNNQLIASDATAPYAIDWTPGTGGYEVYAIATDDQNGKDTSEIITISVVPVMKCSQTSTEASQGSFTTGYEISFETIGSDVEISCELFDNKSGVVAYLWRQSPFAETSMTNVGGKKFTARVSGLSAGENITYAVKFAFSGGMAVTRYFTYEVGSSCPETGMPLSQGQENLLYPNPADEWLTVTKVPENSLIMVYDISGKAVLIREAWQGGTEVIGVGDLPQGLYLLQVKSDEGVKSYRFVVR
ncbi:MAG: glycosyl hydrolase [Bacteroidota bacterium]